MFFSLRNGGAPLVVPFKENGRAIAQDHGEDTLDLHRQRLPEVPFEFFPSPFSQLVQNLVSVCTFAGKSEGEDLAEKWLHSEADSVTLAPVVRWDACRVIWYDPVNGFLAFQPTRNDSGDLFALSSAWICSLHLRIRPVGMSVTTVVV